MKAKATLCREAGLDAKRGQVGSTMPFSNQCGQATLLSCLLFFGVKYCDCLLKVSSVLKGSASLRDMPYAENGEYQLNW